MLFQSKYAEFDDFVDLQGRDSPSYKLAPAEDTVCEGDLVVSEINKHEKIYSAIESKNVALAKQLMEEHFFKLFQHIKNDG